MLQPKNIQNNRLMLAKNFGGSDLGVLGILAAIAGFVGWFSIPSNVENQKLWSFLLILLLSLALMPLMLYSSQHNSRRWKVVWRMIWYSLHNKKYSKNSKIASTKDLIIYDKIENGTVQTKSSQSKTFKIIKNPVKFKIIQFSGINIWSKTNNGRKDIVEDFKLFLNSLNQQITIVRKKELNEYNLIKEKMDNTLNELLKKGANNLSGKEKMKFNYFYNRKSDFDWIEENELIDAYYLVVYASNDKSIYLDDTTAEIFSNLDTMGLFPKILNSFEALNFLHNINRPYIDWDFRSKYKNLENENLITNLEELISFENIIFKGTHFEMDNIKYSIQTISNYAVDLTEWWAEAIFDSDSTIIWHISLINPEIYSNIIDKASQKLATSMELDTKSKFRNNQNRIELQAINETTQLVQHGGEHLFQSKLMKLNFAENKKELTNLENENKKNLEKINSKVNTLHFRQLEALQSISLNQFQMINDSKEQMIARNIAYGFPFTFESHIDNTNFVLGTRAYNPINIDFWKKDEYRVNSNIAFFGTSGSGKTTAMKKVMLHSYLAENASIIVMDPQREYKEFAEHNDATWIDLGTGKTTLNPLQINFPITNIDNQTKVSNSFLVSTQINKFIDWYKIIDSKLDRQGEFLLHKTLQNLYNNTKYNFFGHKEKVTNFANSKYPTINELIKEMRALKLPKEEDEIYKRSRIELINNLEILFGNNGKFNKIYNGHTNIDLKNHFIVIDTKLLVDAKDFVALNAAFYQILSLIQNKINNNFFEQNKKKTMLVIDEAHFFIDAHNLTTLDFIFQTTKTIRKYNGSIVLTTQNPSDFALNENLVNKTQGILKNLQYVFLFKLTGDDIKKINWINSANFSENENSESNYLNDEEAQLIQRQAIGQCILAFSSQRKVSLRMYYNDFEKQLFFKYKEKNNE